MRRLLSFPLLMLVACGSDDGPSGSDTDPVDTDTAVVTTADPTPTAPAGDDEALARGLLAGHLTAEQVIPEVAWSGGWPVQTASDTLIFVHWYEGGSWSVAGDFTDWEPEPMTEGAGFWWVELPVPDPEGARYKLVNGEAWLADPWARSYTYDEFGEISYVRPPADTWRIDRWPALEGQGLVPRDVRIYVPPGSGPWPVLYAHDGQNLFDPAAIWGGWRLQDALAASEPVLVVGIDNTADRMSEYTHVADDYDFGYPIGGDADAYAALVHEDLRPHVEAVYGSTGHDGLMGSSLGGLVSLWIAHRYPGSYDFAASLSGTLGWGAHADLGDPMEAIYVAEGLRDTALYVDSGGSAGLDGVCTDADGDGFPEDDADDADNYCVTRQFADAMAAQGYTWDTDLWHWHEPDAAHDEAAWAARVFRPLGLFLSLDD